MNGYLFTADLIRRQLRAEKNRYGQTVEQLQVWDDCPSAIICADAPEAAQRRFEEWLALQPEGENPIESRIRRMVATQLFEQILTETGQVPVEWMQIANEVKSDAASIPVDDFEQGYWLDVNTVPPAASDIEALRLGLPEDISTGLNWSAEKQFLFLLAVLSASQAPTPEAGNAEPEPDAPESPGSAEENLNDFTIGQRGESADFPQMAEKDAAVLVRARNSAVAVWLWRNFSIGTPLAGNQIRIDPLCPVMKAGKADEAVTPEL